MNDAEFLQWIYSRLQNVHEENPNVDYMIRLRGIITVLKQEEVRIEQNINKSKS